MRLVAGSIVPLTVLLMVVVLSSFGGQLAAENEDINVREACSVTRFQDICVRSLSSFSHFAGRNPVRWARAGLSVALREAKGVAVYLQEVKRGGQIHGRRQRIALLDCTECLQDTVDNLHRCLRILRVLTREGQSGSEVDDLITWMSTALTDEDTCLDGFEGEKAKQVGHIRQRVLNVTYLTSNALALSNKLATTTIPK
ncbi:hypothetical protein SAY86_031266 [Trapa natans]|uniref:Pectinesterase inhibitor domain-containing protein n=1 Tax=Trapa natans TaxID=22666 RepID=A0AAN7M341_TRANT|nr:hypothetical protein SAY86_031266 [Trapa natans]